MKKLLLSLFIFNFIFAKTIIVAASGNTAYVLPVLKQEFNKLYPKINVRFIISSSGKLTSQIENGVPFDIFLSANWWQGEVVDHLRLVVSVAEIGDVLLVRHVGFGNDNDLG
jgi:molybdate transport system substrate-binding protein